MHQIYELNFMNNLHFSLFSAEIIRYIVKKGFSVTQF